MLVVGGLLFTRQRDRDALNSRSGESAPFVLTAMLRLSSDAQDAFEAVEDRIEREGDLHVPNEA